MLFQTTADKLGFIPQDVSFEHNGDRDVTAQKEERHDSRPEALTTSSDMKQAGEETKGKGSPSITVHFSNIPVLAQQSKVQGGIPPVVIIPTPYLLEGDGVTSSHLSPSIQYRIEGGRERETTPIIMPTSSTGKKSIDIAVYRKNVRTALYLHRTSTAQGLLHNLNVDLQDLAGCENHVKGSDLYQIREVVISNDLLAAKIVKDQRNYTRAHRYADHAVQIAHSLEDGELLATTKYMRGCVNLEWGLFGTLEEMKLQPDEQRIQDAIDDLLAVLQSAHSRYLSIHPQLQGFTMLQLARAGCFLPEDQYNRINTLEMNPLMLVEQAANRVNCDPLDDAYTRLLVTGTLSGLHWGAYHLNKAEIFIAMGMFPQALHEIEQLKQLTERTYGRDETRNQTWYSVVMAKILMGLKAYPQVTKMLKEALLACRSINSIQNTVTIMDIFSRLLTSPYGTSADVEELRTMLM